jgi:hypothetical protein
VHLLTRRNVDRHVDDMQHHPLTDDRDCYCYGYCDGYGDHDLDQIADDIIDTHDDMSYIHDQLQV